MNKIFAAYDTDGAIQFIMRCMEVGPTFYDDTGLNAIEVTEIVGDSSHYVVDGVVQPKQPISLITTNTPLTADGTDEAIISGIPAGAQVEWPDGQTDIVMDDEISFSVDLPGTYTFRFTAVPYLDKEITVEAIAAT